MLTMAMADTRAVVSNRARHWRRIRLWGGARKGLKAGKTLGVEWVMRLRDDQLLALIIEVPGGAESDSFAGWISCVWHRMSAGDESSASLTCPSRRQPDPAVAVRTRRG